MRAIVCLLIALCVSAVVVRADESMVDERSASVEAARVHSESITATRNAAKAQCTVVERLKQLALHQSIRQMLDNGEVKRYLSTLAAMGVQTPDAWDFVSTLPDYIRDAERNALRDFDDGASRFIFTRFRSVVRTGLSDATTEGDAKETSELEATKAYVMQSRAEVRRSYQEALRFHEEIVANMGKEFAEATDMMARQRMRSGVISKAEQELNEEYQALIDAYGVEALSDKSGLCFLSCWKDRAKAKIKEVWEKNKCPWCTQAAEWALAKGCGMVASGICKLAGVGCAALLSATGVGSIAAPLIRKACTWACEQFLFDTLQGLCRKLLDWVAGKLKICLKPANICGGIGLCGGAGIKGACGECKDAMKKPGDENCKKEFCEGHKDDKQCKKEDKKDEKKDEKKDGKKDDKKDDKKDGKKDDKKSARLSERR
jgi:hypothetical protein